MDINAMDKVVLDEICVTLVLPDDRECANLLFILRAGRVSCCRLNSGDFIVVNRWVVAAGNKDGGTNADTFPEVESVRKMRSTKEINFLIFLSCKKK